MAFIYKITNLINNKCYIGKTNETIEKRWLDHKSDYLKDSVEKRPLYFAMRKYGPQNFIVEEIENCSSEIVEEREIHWINFFQTYSNGYNATLGGDGKQLYDYDLIVEEYKKIKNVTAVAKIFNCNLETVSKVLRDKNIDYLPGGHVTREKYSIPVKMCDMEGNEIKQWSSMSEAAKWIQQLRPETRKNLSSIIKNISENCKKKRKSAYSYRWEYVLVAE